MMQDFQIKQNVATIEVICDGCRVTVTIERQDGAKITAPDAAVILTKAMSSFPPQRIHYD